MQRVSHCRACPTCFALHSRVASSTNISFSAQQQRCSIVCLFYFRCCCCCLCCCCLCCCCRCHLGLAAERWLSIALLSPLCVCVCVVVLKSPSCNRFQLHFVAVVVVVAPAQWVTNIIASLLLLQTYLSNPSPAPLGCCHSKMFAKNKTVKKEEKEEEEEEDAEQQKLKES